MAPCLPPAVIPDPPRGVVSKGAFPVATKLLLRRNSTLCHSSQSMRRDTAHATCATVTSSGRIVPSISRWTPRESGPTVRTSTSAPPLGPRSRGRGTKESEDLMNGASNSGARRSELMTRASCASTESKKVKKCHAVR
eukprot:scaffold123284_cov32-Tisochrysis_lutea.AAC.4